MRDSKKLIKENNIIEAAKQVFNAVGFKNAKMEDIAAATGITKVTLYSYFQSKENLYLAVTFAGLQLLNDNYYKTLDNYKSKSGLESVIALIDTFMSFCENNFLYTEALLDYFAMIRSSSSGKDQSKLTPATKDSIFYIKLQHIQNLPFKLTVKEIIRGQKDGSILASIDPMLSTLHGWTIVLGYTKVLSASGSNTSPLFNVNLIDLRNLNLKITRALLSNKLVKKELDKL
ncbi:MAG: TetR/AcrR family transcriptional regulator [Saprospiraceae bacterium]